MGINEPWKEQRTQIPSEYQAMPKIKFKQYRRYRSEFISPEPLLELCSVVCDNEPFPECWTWSPEEVAEFVKGLGFPEFGEAFTKNLINGKTLILVEADKLPRISIRNFEKIKILTAAFRDLYSTDQDEFKRCIDLPIRRPRTLYLWYKGNRTGPTAYFMLPSSYFRKVHIIRDETTRARRYYALLNHWNRIPPYQEWCPHVMIGNIRRINPMTGTTMKQNFHPKDHPYLLKDLCIYHLPCPQGIPYWCPEIPNAENIEKLSSLFSIKF